MSLKYITKANNELFKPIIRELSDQTSKKFDNNSKTFQQLNQWKDDELLEIIAGRYLSSNKDTTYITKSELINLMDWKLSIGTFRPSLPKLIKSNNEESVIEVTKAGFKILLNYFKDLSSGFWISAADEKLDEYKKHIRQAMKELCKLKGVGPATSSLLMNCLYEIQPKFTPPFFSDESFMYYVLDPTKPGEKIKYSVKEYVEELLPVYFKLLRSYPEGAFTELERGGWAIKYYSLFNDDKLINVKSPFDENEEWKTFKDDEVESSEPPKKKKRST
ncbi:hypothetical protein CORT_0B02650 [Candida orthopsilosis Co 90-125]|uniref:Uncharacterized protein n=1 Tax=Candida orthopsilosis (strain 90-125) TaxID=1136231 RepID=H8X0U1_CANO9|nr:hypothetical protein CORT_0B02650 [Candida orthopsilosis Co 90-125]CCG21980.1 hypothetical protein CORT_0B02650 [Candida orthopsilosis Co 90-125]